MTITWKTNKLNSRYNQAVIKNILNNIKQTSLMGILTLLSQSRTKRKNYVKFLFSRFFVVPQKVLFLFVGDWNGKGWLMNDQYHYHRNQLSKCWLGYRYLWRYSLLSPIARKEWQNIIFLPSSGYFFQSHTIVNLQIQLLGDVNYLREVIGVLRICEQERMVWEPWIKEFKW